MHSPALNQKEYQRKVDAIEKCGKNMGPHYYIPIIWKKKDEVEYVAQLMCRVCFTRVSMDTLIKQYPEAKF